MPDCVTTLSIHSWNRTVQYGNLYRNVPAAVRNASMLWRRVVQTIKTGTLWNVTVWDLKVQANCHVELRQNKVTHFYSVPYIHVGNQARVIFTRSWIKVYVEQKLVVSHIRSHWYGYTTVGETIQPEEVYYKLCNSIVSLRRKYDFAIFDLTCR